MSKLMTFRTANLVTGQATLHSNCECGQHDEPDTDEAGEELTDFAHPLGTLDVIAERLPEAQRNELLANRDRGRERDAQARRLYAQGHTISTHSAADAVSDEILEAMTPPSTAEFIRQQRGR